MTHGQNIGMIAYLIPNTDVNKQLSDESPVDGWTFSGHQWTNEPQHFTEAVFVILKPNILQILELILIVSYLFTCTIKYNP